MSNSPSAGKTGTGSTGGVSARPNGVTPTPGTYTYGQSGMYDSKEGRKSYPPSGTLSIDAPTHDANGWHQHSTRKRTSDTAREATYLFAPTQIALEGFAAQGYDCTFSKPMKILPQPARPGQKWTDTASCNANGAQMEFKIQASILRSENRAVGAKSVSTLVIRSHTTVNIAGGLATQVEDATTWYSTAYHLIVRTQNHSETTSSFAGTMKSDFLEQLKSLTPA